MKYYIYHHQHKGLPIRDALTREGWSHRRSNVDIALFDHNVNLTNPSNGRLIINEYYNQGATIVTYPHGATGAWWADGSGYIPGTKVFADLVISEGQKYVADIIQPYLKHYPIGWSYCPINEFIKRPIKNILFAPIHATFRTNAIREEALNANSRIFQALLQLIGKYKITVRHLNPLNAIGLKYNSKINFVFGQADGSYSDIDNADLVIAEGTYMHMSVARGKPTIGINQHIPIRPNHSTEDYKLNNWDLYGEYMAYPIDFDDGDLEDLIEKASKEEQVEWKKLFIGKEMVSKDLSNLLISIRNEDIS